MHPSLLAADDEAKYKGVMNADPEMMKQLLVQWLPEIDAESIAVVLAIGRDAAARRVHVQFHSRDGFAVALKACRALIQCSALHPGPKSSWDNRATYCGPARHELPEKLELLCQPTDGQAHSASELDAALPHLLQTMQLDVTSRWLPSSTYGAVQNAAGATLSRVVVHALPRLVGLADLAALVQRINEGKHLLWGGVIKISAPNIPSLARCKQCQAVRPQRGNLPQVLRTCGALRLQGSCALLLPPEAAASHNSKLRRLGQRLLEGAASQTDAGVQHTRSRGATSEHEPRRKPSLASSLRSSARTQSACTRRRTSSTRKSATRSAASAAARRRTISAILRPSLSRVCRAHLCPLHKRATVREGSTTRDSTTCA